MKKKVLVGMSGGVDSSTTAFLLKEKGYDVVGATFIISKSEDNFHLADAAKVCSDIGIEHHVIDVEDEFKKEVVEYFLQGYENCETPSPCIICNRKVKFKVLLDYADKIKQTIKNTLAERSYVKVGTGKFESYDYSKMKELCNE